MRRIVPALLLPAAFVVLGCSSTTPEMQALQDVAEAMGGVEAVLSTTTVEVEGSGTGYVVGQAPTPDVGQLGGDGTYRSQMDLGAHRVRTEATNTAFGFPLSTVAGLDGNVAFNAGGFGPPDPVRIGGMPAQRRLAEYYHHPVALLQAALSEDPAMMATAGALRQDMGHDIVDVTTADGVQLSLHVDPESSLPLAITSMVYDTNLGDVELSTTLAEWTDAASSAGGNDGGGLRLPGSIVQKLGEATVGEYTVTHTVNGDVGDLAAQPDVVAADVSGTPAPNVVVEELADGVWYLAGESHHSVVVEFPSYSVLVEAPLNDARTLAVIEQARALTPDKPLQYVVNTHHHFDHSGGIRAAVAEGLTVITHEINADYYPDMVARSHTLSPDRQQAAQQPLMIETVTGDDIFELRDGDRVMQVLRIVGETHNRGMLAIYLPTEQILIEGDSYTPGGPSLGAAALLETIQQRGLRVSRIAPIHGAVVPFTDLEELVRADAAGAQ